MKWRTQDGEPLFLGGVARAGAIARAGYNRSEILEAVRVGDLHHVRHGWYALPTADDDVLEAVANGGVLGCVSALRFWGVWTTGGGPVHVRRSRHGRRQAPPKTVKVCAPTGIGVAPTLAVDPVPVALLTAVKCLDDHELISVMDSLMNLRLMSATHLGYLLDQLGARHRSLLDRCAWAESGTETLARLRFQAAGIKVRTQVSIPSVGRVDLLVGDRLVVEIDSRAHHTDMTSYQRDRERDQNLAALGYIVVRLTYEQVMFDWDNTLARIMPIVRSDRHRRRRSA